ncbi:Integrase core domain-containing protein [Thorsellia anophelis DSM 18579]|uniref:Integrase core domain-containing protein n=1 Tax=Thorsellia anophelis DSM 18579 TaxID=1123402 RepID=A0A1I0F0E7_9GAMM|nr:Integrase core domain-containing protein [Thorsellia anophelis DSM 18579]
MISKAFTDSRGSAGARTISADGIRYSRYIINKRMKLMGLISKQALIHKYNLADTEHVDIPNHLDRQFAVTEPNQVWAGDVTYIWTSQGWSYLAVVMDLFARKLIGWAMSNSPDSNLTCKALAMTFEARGRPTRLLFHIC